MAIADSSTTSVETSALEEPNNLEYFDYTSMLTSEIFEIAAIADCARARSFEIDENANVYVTLSLRVTCFVNVNIIIALFMKETMFLHKCNK